MDKKQALPNIGGPEAEAFFSEIRERMQKDQKPGRALTDDEERKMQDGFALQEMMQSAGWSIVQEILTSMPKSHIDPRGMAAEEWQFAELNAFHQGNVAKELLEGIYALVNDAHQLQRIKLGEEQIAHKMRI